jgi:hypothetical protein
VECGVVIALSHTLNFARFLLIYFMHLENCDVNARARVHDIALAGSVYALLVEM